MQFAPTGEPLAFKPVNGSMPAILALHQEERDRLALLTRRNNQLLEPFGYQITTQTFPYQLLKNGLQVKEFYDFGPVTLNNAGDDFILPLNAVPKPVIVRKKTIEETEWPRNSYPAFLGERVLQANDTLLGLDPATPNAGEKSQWHWLAQVTLDNSVVYTTTFHSPMAVPGIWGMWSYDGHWVLETYGDVILDGVSLNTQYDYDQTFGFQLIDGKPFFFFQKGKNFGVFYNGQEIPLVYDWLPHYGCCSESEFNPRTSENMVSFFARRDEVNYYVEIGVFGSYP